jgi:enterochelin esterase-like enzyme
LKHLSTSFIETRIFSDFLQREILISIILPQMFDPSGNYKLLLCNDGQDFADLQMQMQLNILQSDNKINDVVVVGIHADHNRLYEYGTAIMPDYAKRGSLAGATTNFVIRELLPFLVNHYPIQVHDITYAGFSLGDLMALDIAWHYPDYFSQVAVFSGALWWRERAIDDGYNDSDRIMHAQIRNATDKPDLKFWFQTGTLDERDDRDGDGVIDSIQDTLECISELEQKGYKWGLDIRYVEIKEGEHNTRTWASALPDFYQWAFGRESVD